MVVVASKTIGGADIEAAPQLQNVTGKRPKENLEREEEAPLEHFLIHLSHG